MSVHPIKSFLFTWLFSLLGMCLGVTLETKCHCLFWPFLGVSFAVLWWYWFTIRRDSRKIIMSILLAISMLGFPMRAEEPPKDEPKPATWGVAIVFVVVVGTVAYVYLRRFCQRHLNRPPPPPETNENLHAISPAALDGSFAATRTYYYWLSCDNSLSAASARTTTAMELSGTFVETANGLELRVSPRKLPAEDLVDSQEFDRIMAGHGVRAGNGIGVESFGRNGRPSTQAEVPIYFSTGDDGQGSFSVGRVGELHAVVMERSPDLRHWEPLGTARISAGQQLRFLDATTESQMFYRFRPL